MKRRKESIEDAKLQKIKRLRPKRVKKSMTKGALIKGMTKRLPYEILANPLFRVGLSRVMRGYAGIYALYRGQKLYYVGLTKNLFGRVRWHLKGGYRHRISFAEHGWRLSAGGCLSDTVAPQQTTAIGR